MLTNQGPPLATLTMGSLYTISYLEYTSSKELTCLEASYTNPTVYMYYYTVYPSADQSVPSIRLTSVSIRIQVVLHHHHVQRTDLITFRPRFPYFPMYFLSQPILTKHCCQLLFNMQSLWEACVVTLGNCLARVHIHIYRRCALYSTLARIFPS